MTNGQPFTKPNERVTVQQLSDHIDFIAEKVQAMSNKTWVPRQSDHIEITRELNSLRRDIVRMVDTLIRTFTFSAKCIRQEAEKKHNESTPRTNGN